MQLILNPQPCTPELMVALEKKGVLTLLSPGKHLLGVTQGQSDYANLYAADERFGPHKLICVTINSTEPSHFLYHNDAEDFMLIDRPEAAPLVLTVSLHHHSVLEKKIENGTVCSDDFQVLICNKNDPYTSFFTMNAGYPHVETVLKETANPPSFYVAESRDLDENIIDFKEYKLIIGESLR